MDGETRVTDGLKEGKKGKGTPGFFDVWMPGPGLVHSGPVETGRWPMKGDQSR
jgi:hypothetical protein